METIRSLRQPGPVHPSRIDCFRGDIQALHFILKPGVTLNQAITTPMVEASFQCGTVTFKGTALNPFRYVMPGPADDPSHVAYFTAPRAPLGMTRIELGNATFGWADGKPSVHCRAAPGSKPTAVGGAGISSHSNHCCRPNEATAWG